MKYLAAGIRSLFPACFWIIALAGIVLASWGWGNGRIVQSGACLLICFGVVTLAGAGWIGWLVRGNDER